MRALAWPSCKSWAPCSTRDTELDRYEAILYAMLLEAAAYHADDFLARADQHLAAQGARRSATPRPVRRLRPGATAGAAVEDDGEMFGRSTSSSP